MRLKKFKLAKRYSHDHDMVVPIYSNDPDPNSLTKEEIIKAFRDRVNYLLANEDEIEQSLGFMDTHDFGET